LLHTHLEYKTLIAPEKMQHESTHHGYGTESALYIWCKAARAATNTQTGQFYFNLFIHRFNHGHLLTVVAVLRDVLSLPSYPLSVSNVYNLFCSATMLCCYHYVFAAMQCLKSPCSVVSCRDVFCLLYI
jgi:hypothetical protein